MNKLQYTYRKVALILAFLMFSSTVGLSVDLHLCQDKIKSFSLFGKAKNCYELVSHNTTKNCLHREKPSDPLNGCSIDKKNCCSNGAFQFKSYSNQHFCNSSIVINEKITQFVIAFIDTFYFSNNLVERFSNHFVLYKPPLKPRDTLVLFQTFLL